MCCITDTQRQSKHCVGIWNVLGTASIIKCMCFRLEPCVTAAVAELIEAALANRT
jgi:hypothetical protein